MLHFDQGVIQLEEWVLPLIGVQLAISCNFPYTRKMKQIGN